MMVDEEEKERRSRHLKLLWLSENEEGKEYLRSPT